MQLRPSLLAILILLVLSTSLQAIAQTQPVPAIFELNRQLGRGVNLGNALEAPREGEWGITLTESYFKSIAQAGFNSVRVPIRWSSHAQVNPPFTIDSKFFERVDWVIEQVKKNKLMAIINIHHYEEMMTQPDEHKARFLALWQQIAERYQDEPPTILFELLNEPNGALTSTKWNRILAEAVKVVRKSNPTRAIIFGPSGWNNIGMIGSLQLPKDPNLIVTFHYYDPFQFTHQGAEWVEGTSAWLGTTWTGTKFEEHAINSAFERAAKWAKDRKVPLFVGEFGAYSKADMEDRVRWTNFVVKTAHNYEMSFAYWEFGAGFGVYDRASKKWNQGLLDALMQK